MATQGRTRTFRTLDSFPYHYTSRPTCQNSETFKYINEKTVFLNGHINGK